MTTKTVVKYGVAIIVIILWLGISAQIYQYHGYSEEQTLGIADHLSMPSFSDLKWSFAGVRDGKAIIVHHYRISGYPAGEDAPYSLYLNVGDEVPFDGSTYSGTFKVVKINANSVVLHVEAQYMTLFESSAPLLLLIFLLIGLILLAIC